MNTRRIVQIILNSSIGCVLAFSALAQDAPAPKPDTQPDNTARNVRDRDGRTMTPVDQGNSKADLNTTARIRKAILDGKNMSVNARNVKIITNQGKVTLRGPVNTAEEKRLIGDIAIKVARLENVDNQLEVKDVKSASSHN